MKNRWEQSRADELADDDLALRVYTSNLLGQEADLVLHGGGNTSVKGQVRDLFGEPVDVLYVKGSGWDLSSIQAAGFPAVRLAHLLRLGTLEQLSDSDMMRELRLGLLDPGAPTPSVEAILHALIPHKFVDHSHADAVVTISNSPGGEEILKQLYGDEVLILPYIMPGFILARQVAAATRDVDWSAVKGIVLLHHGIFTFAEEGKTSYDNMIDLVSQAEDYLAENAGSCEAEAHYRLTSEDCLQLARLRKEAGELFGGAIVLRTDTTGPAAGFASLQNVDELAVRGPLTPDHTIHAKAFAAIFEGDLLAGLERFKARYLDYFNANSAADHQCLDCMPRYGVWKNKAMLYFAGNIKRLQIVADITAHTVAAIQHAEAFSEWQALPERDLFDVEYWELEQAKLKSTATRAPFEGKVVLVSGAASGIGRACVSEFVAAGACVVALDIAEDIASQFSSAAVLGLHCDVTDSAMLAQAVEAAVAHFGGIDVLVNNAGLFPLPEKLENMSTTTWQRSLQVNLTAPMELTRACIPYLQQGFDPAVVFIASKNVPAPGPGAAAYSAAKAGMTQLMRVAALELGASGIRVNALHPNAVYDTALWTDELLAERATHYGLSVADYKANNVLGVEVRSEHVARATVLLAGKDFSRTTGAQLPVDGGNERVI